MRRWLRWRALLAAPARQLTRRGTNLVGAINASRSLAGACVGLGIALSWAIGLLFGGANHVGASWFYVPIVLAAARFGIRDALIVGMASAFVGGPLLPGDIAHSTQQELSVWITQGAFFVVLAGVFAFLFDRLRRSLAREFGLANSERTVRLREVTQRLQVETKLRESEVRYRQMFERNQAIKLLIDPETGAILDANPAAGTFYRYGVAALRHMTIGDLNMLSWDQMANQIQQVLAGELPTLIRRHRLATGEMRNVEVHSSRVEVEGRDVLYTIIHDVTERHRMESELRESESRYRGVVETSPDAIMIADLTGTILVLNPAAASLYGCGHADELKGVNALDLTVPGDRERLRAAMREGAKHELERPEPVEYQQIRRDGTTFSANTRVAVLRDDTGRPISFLVTVRDISERKRANEATRRLAAIVDASSDAVASITPEGIITSWNPGAEHLYGYSASEIIGRPVSTLVPSDLLQEWTDLFEQVEHGIAVKHVETILLRKGDRRFVASLSISPIHDGHGTNTGFGLTAYDISERKVFEEQLKHQALHDGLTRLPNRTLLHDRLEQATLSAHRAATSMALLLIDLDRFKDVNDTLGHHAGDVLLQEIAIRLEDAVRESDTVARLGGDEFAIILPCVDEQRAKVVAQNIHTALQQPLILEGQRIDVGASIGIALYPAHGTDASALLRRADVAMYAAKRSGDGHRTYASNQDRNSPTRLTLVADLRAAIDQNQLLLHYQPKVNIRTGMTEHVEALVRWKHPAHGLIPPGEFISIAEETGLIEPLTLWVLKTALRQCADWRRAGVNLSVAVNLSTRNLRNAQLSDSIAWLLRSAGVDPSALIVEITESSLMDDPEGSRVVLTHLHEMGVKISIDDFGTGYSSLAYLKQLPVDEIKIDRSFVLGMNRNGTVIVRSVIDLGHNLGIEVTAEGAEDEEMLDMLARMGCDMAQGYYLSRPLPAPDLTAWLTARTRQVRSPASGQEAILVVDDNPVYQELIQVLLTDEGYEVVTAGSAEEAMGTLETLTPDLVLTDVQLPGMSGLELVRQIRRQPHLRDTVIVAITDAAREEDAQYALSLGCDVYAAKPGRNKDVVQLVREHLHGPLRREAGL